jgi:hypothetical protein
MHDEGEIQFINVSQRNSFPPRISESYIGAKEILFTQSLYISASNKFPSKCSLSTTHIYKHKSALVACFVISTPSEYIAMCALQALADKGRRAGENLMNKFRARTADKKSKRERETLTVLVVRLRHVKFRSETLAGMGTLNLSAYWFSTPSLM